MSVPGGVMMDSLSGASPQQIQQILAMGGTPDQQALIAQQIAQANYLRNTPNPQGRNVGQWGHLYVAPSPLEVIGDKALQYEGYRQGQTAQQKLLGLAQQNQQGRQSYLDILRKMYQNQQTPPTADDSGASNPGPSDY